MKCDETKPACLQCNRRGVTCAGYPKILKWRPFGQTKERLGDGDSMRRSAQPAPQISLNPLDSRPTDECSRGDSQSTKPVQSERPPERVPDHGELPAQYPISHTAGSRTLRTFGCSRNGVRSIPSSFSQDQPTNPPLEAIESTSDDVRTERMLDESDNPFFDAQQSPSKMLANSSSNTPPRSVGLDSFLSPNGIDGTHYQVPHLIDLIFQGNDSLLEPNAELDWNVYNFDAMLYSAEAAQEEDIEAVAGQMPQLDLSLESSLEPVGHARSPSGHTNKSGSQEAMNQQAQFPDSTPEMIRHIFEHQTCGILSINEDHTKNPWRTLVWPLASNFPPLHHALLAMVCLHMCRTQPQFHLPGQRHFQCSTQALAENEDQGGVLLEAAIATKLVLGFAESWDLQKASTGIDHITDAKMLIRQAATKIETSKLDAVDLNRWTFLANTCLYMDVIARLTCSEPQSSNDTEFMTACSLLSSCFRGDQQLDPLMGCATTLFPMIGRLGELVGRVRKRTEKRNSPAIISKAIELRMDIEKWTPPIDSESSIELSPYITDAIQTAEAYRWASLLQLRQAVPELPWTHSIWELASKVLIFLATIPLTSRTTILQIFPLMVAGCEAFDEDDRDWVRERWELMSRRMITGIVNRCNDITIEVWQRRDRYEARLGAYSGSHRSSPSNSIARSDSNGREASDVSEARNEAIARSIRETGPHSSSLDFPVSAAFKKEVDPVTRAGFIDYTVKGELHWLGVMKDWNWEGES